jgi:hypothetical protein
VGVDELPDREGAARWLMVHGLHSTNTVKSWATMPRGRGPYDKRAILLIAIEKSTEPRSARTWQLRRCGDPACVCAELLDA